MKKVIATWQNLSPYLRSILRIAAAFTFTLHGTMKLFAFPTGRHLPLTSEIGLAGVLETFGGAMLIFGIFTRPVAFILAGEMAVAFFQVHFPRGFWPVLNGGELAFIYCFVWLYLSAAGPGPWSIDVIRERYRLRQGSNP